MPMAMIQAGNQIHIPKHANSKNWSENIKMKL